MLNDIKALLGIEGEGQDSKLRLIIAAATARLKVLLGGIEPPESLDYIIREVAIVRFNRIGSEGMTNHSVEGESITFGTNDFAEYENDIQAYLESQKESAKGRLRFL